MTDYELEQLCQRNPNCDCDCMNCPFFARYHRSELGLDEEEYDENED